jgi:hypothetical protein
MSDISQEASMTKYKGNKGGVIAPLFLWGSPPSLDPFDPP